MKIFLLEGPDGAGKSTLADQLNLLAGNVYVEHLHFSQPKGDDIWAEYGEPIAAACARINAIDENGWLIIDRLHISEKVYGPIFRGRIAGKRWQWRKLEEFLDTLPITRLYVSPGWKTVMQRFLSRGDDFVVSDQLYDIHRKYYRLLGNDPKWFRIDSAGQRLMAVLAQ